jgi:NADH-quinone oxidoreductase subunit M
VQTLLLITLFLPLAGALLLHGDRRAARWYAIGATLLALATGGVLVACYPGGVEPFAATNLDWLDPAAATIHTSFSIAIDGLSVWLFGLTLLLTVVAVLVGWEAIDRQASLYYRLLLLLETGMLGVFVARDVILFYIFFEFTLIPLFFLIGIWGSEERRLAATKFFLFTLTGSLLTFLGLLSIVLWVHHHPADGSAMGPITFAISDLTAALTLAPIEPKLQIAIFAALFAGFAIKAPLFPLHTWLPLAHVQAPAAGSVLLAGVLLKVGAYGFVRFNLPMLPHATATLMPAMLWISVAGILYGALVALAQRDMKRLIAYSSVSHMGFCMLGVFAANPLGLQGGVLQMVNHGLSTGGLFAVVGMIYQRYHTRQIADLGGLAKRLPVLAFFTLVLALSSIGLPGLNGFAGEFLLLLGMFQRAWISASSGISLQVVAVSSVAGVVLGAWYMLWLVQRVFFGPLQEPSCPTHKLQDADVPLAQGTNATRDPNAVQSPQPVRDLSLREILTLSPLLVFIVWIGLQPGFFLSRMKPTLEQLLVPITQIQAETQSLPPNP